MYPAADNMASSLASHACAVKISWHQAPHLQNGMVYAFQWL